MGNDVQVILDDKSSLFNYSGGKWTVHSDVRWLGGTSTYPQFADTSAGTFGSLDVTFQGTGIAFIGNTPATSQSQNVTVTIDGGTSYNSSYGDPHPQNYLQWYQSPVLPDGTHKITLDGVAGTSVDFALITAGPKTPFDTSQKILVDDDNPEIKYNGSWTRNGDPFVSSENPNGRPVHNGTHQSSTPGDTATFNFAGTSAAVYGIFSWTKTGSMSVTYTLDGAPTVNTYSVTPTTPEYINGLRQHQNYLLFSNDSLSAGPHALVINVTKSDGLVFVMDYITYSPSFTSLDTKPDLTQTSPTSSATSSKAKSGPPVGAIVGAIIGAIALLVVIAAVFLVLRRRKQRHDGGERPTRITPNTSYKIDPNQDVLDPVTIQPFPAPHNSNHDFNPASSRTSFLPSEPTSSSAPASTPAQASALPQKSRLAWSSAGAAQLTDRQREIQRRMQELDALVSAQGPGAPQIDENSDAGRQIAQLRARVDELVRENAMLGGAPPPAYQYAP